eukprot:430392-Pleurochrysis_carterae.AAC.6
MGGLQGRRGRGRSPNALATGTAPCRARSRVTKTRKQGRGHIQRLAAAHASQTGALSVRKEFTMSAARYLPTDDIYPPAKRSNPRYLSIYASREGSNAIAPAPRRTRLCVQVGGVVNEGDDATQLAPEERVEPEGVRRAAVDRDERLVRRGEPARAHVLNAGRDPMA